MGINPLVSFSPDSAPAMYLFCARVAPSFS